MTKLSSLICSTTTWVPKASEHYTWEDVGIQDGLARELPGLFNPSIQNVFQTQDGIKLTSKLHVVYEDRISMLKTFNKQGIITFSELSDGFLVTNTPLGDLESLPGVKYIREVYVIQRKKFTPVLIPTGTYVDPRYNWASFELKSELTNYGILNSFLNINSETNEVSVGVQNILENTIVRKGDKLGDLFYREGLLEQAA